ncbi:MAG TPA: CPBP family intramembrane glutamic endopeptidase [Thermoanaerobaculia bacterium]|jgi:membrane protease YdiL (CAAX protease family)
MNNAVFFALLAAGCAGILLAFLRARARAVLVQDGFADPPRRMAALGLLAGVLLLTVAIPFAAGLAGAQTGERRLTLVSVFAVHAVLAAFLAVYYMLSGRRDLAGFLRIRSPRPLADLSTGVLVGAAGWLLTVLLAAAAIAVWLLVRGKPPAGASEIALSPTIAWLVTRPVWLKIAIVVSAMFLEEFFFRGFLQTRVGPLAATLMFTAAHGVYGQPVMLLGILVISAVLSAAYAIWGNILPCIVAHGVYNAIQMFLVLPVAAEFSRGMPGG